MPVKARRRCACKPLPPAAIRSHSITTRTGTKSSIRISSASPAKATASRRTRASASACPSRKKRFSPSRTRRSACASPCSTCISRRGYYSFNTYSKRVAADLAETTHGRVVAARGHPDSPAVAVLGNVVELVVGHRVPAFLAGRGRGHADDRDRPARALDDLAAEGVVVAVQNEFRPRLGDDAAERLGIDQPLAPGHLAGTRRMVRSEGHTSELQSLMRISYAVFCFKKTTIKKT